MLTILLPRGVNPIPVNEYIVSYRIIIIITTIIITFTQCCLSQHVNGYWILFLFLLHNGGYIVLEHLSHFVFRTTTTTTTIIIIIIIIIIIEVMIVTITYLLTPWCRVLLEKLTDLQLVKKFPAFHGSRMFITALTSVRHLSLSWASPIQFIYPHPTSWRSILILSTHLRLGLPSGLFPSGFPTKTLYTPLLTHTRHMPNPSHSSRFYHPHNIGSGVQII